MRASPETARAPLGMLEDKIENLQELQGKGSDFRTLYNQAGFLIQDHTRISGQLYRLLMPAPEEREKAIVANMGMKQLKLRIEPLHITSLGKNIRNIVGNDD